MARKKSRTEAKRQRNHIITGVALLFVVVLIVAGIGIWLVKRDAPLDKVTMCPAAGPLGHVVLLVDKTDPLNYIQKEAFSALLQRLASEGVEPGHLVSVFALGEDYKATAKPIFELCNPGRGEGKSEWTANLRMLQRQFQEQFRAPMLKLADELQATRPGNTSPVFEMLQLVSINSFAKHDVDGLKRLIIVSDMLHNTPEYSMYRMQEDFKAFQSSDYSRRLNTDFAGARVELHYIMNTPHLQTRRQLLFWEEYFKNGNGLLAAVRPLEG